VRYDSPVDWARTTDNPFVDMNVERKMTVAFTAAGAETYTNMADRKGHELSGKAPWHTPAPEVGPCVRKHKKNGTLYLAGINHDTVVAGFTIDGVPVAPDVDAQIRSFLRAPQERERGLDFRVWTLEKLVNAVIG
jgi:hypothetical protein